MKQTSLLFHQLLLLINVHVFLYSAQPLLANIATLPPSHRQHERYRLRLVKTTTVAGVPLHTYKHTRTLCTYKQRQVSQAIAIIIVVNVAFVVVIVAVVVVVRRKRQQTSSATEDLIPVGVSRRTAASSDGRSDRSEAAAVAIVVLLNCCCSRAGKRSDVALPSDCYCSGSAILSNEFAPFSLRFLIGFRRLSQPPLPACLFSRCSPIRRSVLLSVVRAQLVPYDARGRRRPADCSVCR